MKKIRKNQEVLASKIFANMTKVVCYSEENGYNGKELDLTKDYEIPGRLYTRWINGHKRSELTVEGENKYCFTAYDGLWFNFESIAI